MSLPMPSDTLAVLGEKDGKYESRSLFMDRFADPGAREAERDEWFKKLIGLKPVVIHRGGLPLAAGAVTLYAQLQSRLMVNMAGGVMENAGLCLDRFGLPYVPGSAVKGCARRMAIQKLLEATAVPKKVELLVQIALVFGWGQTEWSKEKRDGLFQSDFAYAVGDDLWAEVSTTARKQLPDVNHFGGLVGFLPAQPVDVSGAKLPLPVPALGQLEMDIVTCHHMDYYSRKEKNGALVMPVALDSEAPNPVKFPAVAAGHVFAFVLAPLRACSPTLLAAAESWLKEGLSLFGLGAKTAAGYGWFDCCDQVQTAVRHECLRLLTELKKAKDEAAAEKAEAERLAKAPPFERWKSEYSKLADEAFAAKAKDFASLDADQRHGFALALKQRRETAKRWAKKKPDLLKPWLEYGQTLQPPIQLP